MNPLADVPGAPCLILASTSVYRRQLLERLGLRFATSRPEVDESARPGEDAQTLTGRLAQAKAEAVAQRHSDSVIVGSDQLATCDGRMLGKPGTEARAVEQLRSLSGARVTFYTAVHVMHSGTPQTRSAQERQQPARAESHMDTTTVHFRSLSDEEIRRYVAREQPLDCAGGFKAEGLGISLFERIESQDPTGLIGLPLIWLAGALRRQGFTLP